METTPTELQLDQFKAFKHRITRFMMVYKFALDTMETKIETLQEEFQFLHEYNPIEHTKSRLKSPESILKKLFRKNLPVSLPSIQDNIRDIAGMRITCSFISDIYTIQAMLASQTDLRIVETKDYIKQPKPNGYQSLHLLVEVPVYMSDRQENVYVEIQIRTIAMDFWASLEHKIFYKYNQSVPAKMLSELKAAADAATALDQQMERLHREIGEIKEAQQSDDELTLQRIMVSNQQFSLPSALMDMMDDGKNRQ
ncbi:GTP pyrophosphokinase family protein [Paenibacillus sp. IB182496]|uniref:GTP pyrophosphokinase family protein n=1 Tax=Paenibacillus sabuli TaxID=2772509 RepID=A0A927GTB5_9BACL|nr:GTP pyrophosphokinase family protein [Paenibacillus sabuli]MBD2847413.1 GTP pyrophosphokinase family protein [Paenibacillus sabuli]